MMQMDLTGKTALVTGAAKRIGRKIAETLADEGANIVVHYHDSRDEARGLAKQLIDRGVRAWTLRANLAYISECEALIQKCLDTAGNLDILINNAAILTNGGLYDTSFHDLMQNMQVNAWAPFVLSREFARRVGRGQIINVLDSRIRGYDWSHVGYIISKHVLTVLTEMMALAFAPGLTVNGVAPGFILPPPDEGEDYLDRLASAVPLKRHGEPSDVAETVLYLLKSDFVTGEVIAVDGGRHLEKRDDGSHFDS